MRIAFVIFTVLMTATASYSDTTGRFVGRLILTDEDLDECFALDDDGWYSIFRLVEDFEFVSPENLSWTVPSGTCVNGASIPAAFWSVIGGPWSGKYRRASVIHDHYVRVRTRTWQETHRVFYDGMLASDVPSRQAKLMYYAVRRFGKRWGSQTRSLSVCSDNADCAELGQPLPGGDFVVTPKGPADDWTAVLDGLKLEDMSLDAIDRLADEQLRADMHN